MDVDRRNPPTEFELAALAERMMELRPATDADRLPIRVEAAFDSRGRIVGRISHAADQPTDGGWVRYAWAIDVMQGTFAAVELDGGPSDLDRLIRFRQRVSGGRPVDREMLAGRLRRLDQGRQAVVVRPAGAPVGRTAAAALRGGGPRSLVSSETFEVSDLSATSESCDGDSYTMFAVEDPVMVNVTETTLYSWWQRYTDESGWSFYHGTDNQCWGKPATGWLWPLDTAWSVMFCQPGNEDQNPGFRHSVSGTYINWDFWGNMFATGSSTYVEDNANLSGYQNWSTQFSVWGEASWLLMMFGELDHYAIETCTYF